MGDNIRPSAVAGQFYPGTREELDKILTELLSKAQGVSSSKKYYNHDLKALVVPHAGYIYSGIVAAAGFNLLDPKQFSRPPRVVLIGPSHNADFVGLATSAFDKWSTPLGTVKLDPLREKMIKRYPNVVKYLEEAHEEEHALEVELPFLQKVLPEFTLIPLLTGHGTPAEFAGIFKYFEKEIDLFVVSSDLSHYYPYEITTKLDRKANTSIPRVDIQTVYEEVEACGKIAILSILYLADNNNWRGVLVDYKNSGDTGGERESAVGYGCYAFYQ